VYAENGLWKQARGLQRKVIDLRVKRLGRRHEDTLQAQRSLGIIYWNLFDVKPCVDIQFDIMKSRWFKRPTISSWMIWPPWKPDHVAYCTALSDITQSLWLAGKYDLSRQAGERAIEGLLKHRGPDDPETLDTMFNLARSLHYLRDYERSHRYLTCVLRKRKRFLGPDHPDTLMARTELGTSYRALGRMHLVERLIGNVLEAHKRILGEEHAYTLWSVNEYSKILCDGGRSVEAVSMLQGIIPIVVRTLGEDHVGMFMTRSNLARAYALSKRWNDAENCLQNLSTLVDSNHPDWINIMCGYIHVRIKVGRLQETEDDCTKVLGAILKNKSISLW
jgi:tetratricopeptide (TPR) repeat protein